MLPRGERTLLRNVQQKLWLCNIRTLTVGGASRSQHTHPLPFSPRLIARARRAGRLRAEHQSVGAD